MVPGGGSRSSVVLCFIVADDVSIDPATNKPTARGIFFDVNSPLPVRLDFSVLITVTECIIRPCS